MRLRVPKKESSDDDLIDLARSSGDEILELAKGKYGKRDGGDESLWSFLIAVILILIAGIPLVLFTVGPMLVDPLFLYVPTINENIKCLVLDEKLKKTVIVLRSTRNSRSLNIMKFLNSFILLQYVVRAYPMYKICTKLNKDTRERSKELAKRKKLWTRGVLNFIMYILASHVLGAFWYFFSIQRVIDCWISTCRSENGCNLSTLQCHNTPFKNVTLLNDLCPTNPPNPMAYDFGIFVGTLQSGIVGTPDFPQKLLMCLSWGLRNLSSFASNLNSSTYAWESIFVIFISMSGLLLFMYLLGHVQTFMQAISRKSDIWKQMRSIDPQIDFMLYKYDLPEGLEFVIWKLVREALEEDDDLVVENIFSVLPWELKMHIKRHLFLDKLKIVPGLENVNREVLEAIMKHLEPVNYTHGSYIIREGEPLDRMLFITQGSVLAYKTSSVGGESGSSSIIRLAKDGFYGQELIGWAAASTSFSDLPISAKTVKSCNKVEVFVLMAEHLQLVVSQFREQFNTERSPPADSTRVDINDSGISEVA